MRKNNLVYSMLGLCMKAGKLAYGSDMCEDKIKNHMIRLLIVAEDASEGTKSRFQTICHNHMPCYIFGCIDDISRSIGKENKAIIGIMDEGFAKKTQELIEESLKGANS